MSTFALYINKLKTRKQILIDHNFNYYKRDIDHEYSEWEKVKDMPMLGQWVSSLSNFAKDWEEANKKSKTAIFMNLGKKKIMIEDGAF